MLNKLRDLAQKKAKAEELVTEFRSKKEREKIRSGRVCSLVDSRNSLNQ